MGYEGTLVKGRFRVGEFIGSGSYCHAYKSTDQLTSEEVVVKFFFENGTAFNLYNAEVFALRECQGIHGIPKIVDVGAVQMTPFIVTDYCGVDLSQMLLRKNMVIEAEALKTIARKLITILEGIHQHGFLHLDVKPDNILISQSGDDVVLIDFGFAKKYMESGRHMPATRNNTVRGNVLFCSSAYLRGESPSRKSDLESLAYTLIMLEKGSLPWAKCRGFTSISVETCLSLRDNFLRSEFISTLSSATRSLLTHCLGLKFSDTPDYRHLESLFASTVDTIEFFPRARAGKGKFFPLTFVAREKSERRMPRMESETSQEQPDAHAGKKKLLIRNVRQRASCRDLGISVEVHKEPKEHQKPPEDDGISKEASIFEGRTTDRRDTNRDLSGPKITEELRARISALKVSKEIGE